MAYFDLGKLNSPTTNILKVLCNCKRRGQVVSI